LMHGGWIFHLQAIPGKETSRIRLLSTSAALAELPVAAELAYARPGGAGRPAGSTVRTGIADASLLSGANLTWYTPLDQAAPGQFDSSRGLAIDEAGNSLFVMAGTPWKLDRWGNPTSSPNAGRDLAALRVAFLVRLSDFTRWKLGPDPGAVMAAHRGLERDFSPLLAEAPYRAVKGTYTAKAFAESGALKDALGEIERCWQDVPYDAVGLTLAQVQATAGRLDDAAATLRRVASTAVTPAGNYHGPQLLVRVAMEKRDPILLRDALEGQGSGRSPEALAVAAARARLWWDEVQEADTSLHALDTAPDGEAIACLVRWRLGRSTADDLDAMAATERLNPDAQAEARLAKAAVLIATGHGGESVSELDSLMLLLRPDAGSSLRLRQLLDLAQALRAKALLAAGRRAEAAAEARRLAGTLRPGLLPAILAAEVLRDVGPRGPRPGPG
ncbi:MAG: hypothetical protein HY825_15760, partial [Acidobacteria bacterium]|nr:hypothetical protein [Acidobacteriota bacterium]